MFQGIPIRLTYTYAPQMSPYWILLSGISFCLNCLFVIPNRISISKEIRFNGNNSFVAFFSKLLSSLSSLYQPKGSLLVIVLPQSSPSTPTLRYPHPSQRLQVRCRPSRSFSSSLPKIRWTDRSCAICIQRAPAILIRSTFHLVGGQSDTASSSP